MTSNKDYLSQEEIDALLRQSSEDSSYDTGGGSPQQIENYLSSLEQDALGEIGNITFGSAATALSTLLGKKVDITTPKVSIISRDELETEFPQPHVAVHVNYVDGFDGINLLVIQTRDAQVIADLMMGGDGTGQMGQELSEIHISAVQEAMNQMMGSSATSMSTIFNRFVNISPPGIDIIHLSAGEGDLPDEDVFVKISFRLIIGDLIDSTIMQLLPVPFAKEMVSTLLGGGTSEPERKLTVRLRRPRRRLREAAGAVCAAGVAAACRLSGDGAADGSTADVSAADDAAATAHVSAAADAASGSVRRNGKQERKRAAGAVQQFEHASAQPGRRYEPEFAIGYSAEGYCRIGQDAQNDQRHS